MSIVLAIVPIGIGIAVGAAVAAELGFGAAITGIAGIGGALIASAVYEYSPLPMVVGFASGPQRSAGFWGFSQEENDE